MAKKKGLRISPETVYSELYNEMRRYRDSELNSSVWFTAIIVGGLSIIVTDKFSPPGTNSILNDDFLLQVIIAFLFTAIGSFSLFSVRYASLRYDEIRDYLKRLEPKWTFVPSNRTVRPRHLIYVVEALMTIISISIVLWSPDMCQIFTILFFVLIGVIVVGFLPMLTKGNKKSRDKTEGISLTKEDDLSDRTSSE